MNYRHIFHAGNICDVVKHAVWALVLGHLREKDKPFYVLDTHAGVGLYDLHDPRAQKTGEAQAGILKLVQSPPIPALGAYYETLRRFNSGWCSGDSSVLESFRFYPGSPLIAARLMRPQDRLVVCELHEEDVVELKRNARAFLHIQIHHRDGYEALGAFLPPAEKRGVVLIDPPYESPNEFGRLAEAVVEAHRRWTQGIFAIWYPIKERPAIWHFHEKLTGAEGIRLFAAEFVYQEETRHDRLNGCGLMLINPPWQLDKKLEKLFPALHEALQTAYRGIKLVWLNGREETPG